jgi:hypothetical protein
MGLAKPLALKPKRVWPPLCRAWDSNAVSRMWRTLNQLEIQCAEHGGSDWSSALLYGDGSFAGHQWRLRCIHCWPYRRSFGIGTLVTCVDEDMASVWTRLAPGAFIASSEGRAEPSAARLALLGQNMLVDFQTAFGRGPPLLPMEHPAEALRRAVPFGKVCIGP